MRVFVQNALRRFTRIMRPLALKSAGKEGSGTSVVRHTGRQSGRVYETPVVTARNGDFFLIALPYGERTDWLRNVLAKGSAVIVAGGHAFEIEQPEVVPMSEVTAYFRPGEQRMQRQFRVASALQVRLWPQAAPGN
jgi:deazaflavin-dependent oxidoreductase (nitroreductase family)